MPTSQPWRNDDGQQQQQPQQSKRRYSAFNWPLPWDACRHHCGNSRRGGSVDDGTVVKQQQHCRDQFFQYDDDRPNADHGTRRDDASAGSRHWNHAITIRVEMEGPDDGPFIILRMTMSVWQADGSRTRPVSLRRCSGGELRLGYEKVGLLSRSRGALRWN